MKIKSTRLCNKPDNSDPYNHDHDDKNEADNHLILNNHSEELLDFYDEEEYFIEDIDHDHNKYKNKRGTFKIHMDIISDHTH